MARERQLNKSRGVPAPSGEQIKNLLSAMGVSSRTFGDALGHPACVIDCWITGKQTPNDEDSRIIWKEYFRPYVQTTLPGFVRTEVIPPPHSKRREEIIGV